MATLLSKSEIQTALKKLHDWKHHGKSITRLYVFQDFTTALLFVNYVGHLAEKADHHPDIDIRYRKVTLVLSTHSEGGLTDKDMALAKAIDRT